MEYAVELKTKKFKTLFDYWLWYYRKLPRWRLGREREIYNLSVATRQGHAIRMERIRKRKESRLKTLTK